MPAPTMTYALAMAAATDAANRQMRAAGRIVWSADDFDEACRVFRRLWIENEHKGES